MPNDSLEGSPFRQQLHGPENRREHRNDVKMLEISVGHLKSRQSI